MASSWPADLRHAGATIPAFMASRGLQNSRQLPETKAQDRPTGAAALEADAQGQRYRVGKVVAKGGMGAILAVEDRNVRRTVAMKVMLHPEDVTEHEELRFIEEAQVTGQLEHPGIVPVYELGVDGADHLYYTMKLLHGATLKDILAGIAGAKPGMAQQYPLSRLLTIFQKICDALAFAHTKGVVHRDLKPANVMVGDFGEVLVLDWGLAKVVGQEADHGTAADGSSPASSPRIESTRGDAAAGDDVAGLRTLDGEIVGTPEFMAPEQALGKVSELDTRTDIYALGAMLYTILALRPPVAGQDSGQVLQAVARGEIVPPSALGHGSSRPLTEEAAERPGTRGRDQSPEQRPPPAARAVFPHCPHGTIPPALSAIAMKALSRQPEARYATVKELQADIERYQGGFATVAEHAGLGRQLALLVRRHKGFVTATAAVFVAIVAGLIVSLAQWRKAVSNERVAVAARAQAEASQQTAEQRRAQAEAEQYRAMIGLAAAAIAQDDAARGRRTLDGCPGALRHWEWGYLSAQCRRTARAYLPGSAGAYPLAQCAAGGVVTCPAWSDRLLCFDVVRGVKTVEVALPWKKRGSHRVAVLPGAQRVAIIANQPADRLAVVDLAEKRVLWVAEVRCGLLPDVAASADGRHLVVCAEGDGDGATLWDAATGERLGRFGEKRGIVRRVACAPHGARAVLAGAGAGVYDLADGREIGTLAEDAKYVWHVGFSPDGTRIATADGDGRVRVWDTETLACSATLGGHAGAVAAVAFTPDGTGVLTGGRDRCLRAWRVETGCLEAEKILPQPIASILVTADGSTALVGSGTGARRVELAAWLAGTDTDTIVPHGFERICRSPSGDRLLVVDSRGTSLLDTVRLDVKVSLASGSTPYDVAWTPDGNTILIGTRRNSVAVHDSHTGQRLREIPLPASDSAKAREDWVVVAVADGGHTVVAGGNRAGCLFVYDLTSGQEQRRLATGLGSVWQLEASPDARNLVVAGSGGNRQCWDLETWTRREDVKLPAGWRMRFSPDGRWLAMQLWTGGITLAAFPSGPRIQLHSPQAAVRALAFSPDGKRLVSAGSGEQVLVWDTTTGAQVLALGGHTDEVFGAEFTQDGHRLVTSGHDRRLVIREADPWE